MRESFFFAESEGFEPSVTRDRCAFQLCPIDHSRAARPDQTPAALTSIDLDILYRERGFELYWEGFRRSDQIRFGKYEDAWTEKTDTDVNKRLFPIPQSAIDGASNIEGFLEQNAGY